MIQAPISKQELRIGNWVQVRLKEHDHTFIERVEAIYLSDLIIDDSHFDFEQVYGIPLTEEMLLKMGFEKLPHFTITNSLILKLSRGRMITVSSVGSPNLMVWIENVEGKDITDLVCIHNWDYDGELHVHTLQNIVWLLSKQELTLS